jgi:hypothetical protein
MTKDVFTLTQPERENYLRARLSALTEYHRSRSLGYARILAALGYQPGQGSESVASMPWLPVRLFKEHSLKSVPDEDVHAIVTSSGTTGDVSRIFLDRATAKLQRQFLAQTLRAVLGSRRLPMLVIDSAPVISRGGPMSARQAGVLGMMPYGRDHIFFLSQDGQVMTDQVRRFLVNHGRTPFLIFGFTFLVGTQLPEVALANNFDLSNGILVHTGGWKKLADQAVDNTELRRRLEKSGLRHIHNFYGMAEQLGTIFLEGSGTHQLYCPDFADIIVRDPETWDEAPLGVSGVIEVVSTLPSSYPGHLLLTEDVGIVHGVDDGDWPGKRFSVLGRLPRSEPRGCSDVTGAAA